MKRFNIIILFCLYITLLSGQNSLSDAYTVGKPETIKPTPQSQIFEQYINHPVTEYNGLPDITIPLYELEVDGLKIPIELTYHAGGIKYMIEPTSDGEVGAGWSIKACGYRITRTIHGKPDEKHIWYDKNYAVPYLEEEGKEKDLYLAQLYYPKAGQCVSGALNSSHPNCESEYDIFSYMLPTSNGHFILNEHKLPVILEQNLDKISVDSNLEDFRVIDNNGFTYYMGKHPDNTLLAEWRKVDGKYNEKVGWPLKRIVSPFNGIINFEYREFKNTPTSYSCFPVNEAPMRLIEKDDLTNSYSPTYYTEEDVYHMNPAGSYTELVLDKIQTDRDIITFTRPKKSTPQTLITKIEVKDRSGSLIKSIDFEYKLPTASNWHCLLTSIVIKASGSLSKTYKFEYYEPPFDGLYPDQWGYYKKGISKNGSNTGFGKKLFIHDEFLSYWIIDYINDRVRLGQAKSTGIKNSIYKYTANRSGDNLSPHYFSLKKIIYPTGGNTEYIYEPHDLGSIKGAGQRIQKIISSKDEEEASFTTEYKYGENEDGQGFANFNLHPSNFVDNILFINKIRGSRSNEGSVINSSVSFYRDPVIPEMSNVLVNYEYVTTYQYNNTAINGKKNSKYQIPRQYVTDGISYLKQNHYLSPLFPPGLTFSHYGGHRMNHEEIKEYHLWKKPLLILQEYYDKENRIVQKDTFAYIESDINIYNGIKVRQKVFFDNNLNHTKIEDIPIYNGYYSYAQLYVYLYVFSIFSHLNYHITSGAELLSEKKTITYNATGNIIKTEKYAYDDKNRLTATSCENSSNGFLFKEFTYPETNTALDQKNMVSTIIETKTYNNHIEIGKIKYYYSTTEILPDSVETIVNSIPRTDIVYNKYSAKGKIEQYTTNDGISTTILWGYNGQYPVAEIKNATYHEFMSSLTSSQANFLTSILENNSSSINSSLFRDLLMNAVPNTLVTVYTYKPLVGMTSMTDPRGITTYYDYDDFGRLKETYIIENGQKKILQSHDYHYREQ